MITPRTQIVENKLLEQNHENQKLYKQINIVYINDNTYLQFYSSSVHR